ncbi:MAG: prolipoprotein diacylglyceryl transferase [Candidatus Omnitrophica bacterium]|nr:prolipoprotein diacylglyceryl transferase [Candidatus Omnitrophota bacterium]
MAFVAAQALLMQRILFQWGPVTVYTYGVMLVAAFLTATWVASRAAQRLPPGRAVLSSSQIVDLFCLVMLSGVLGARLFFVAQHWKVYLHQPQEIPAIWHGGLVWYGGFLGGLASIVFYLRLHRISLLRGMDQVAPFVALGHGIGRIGCFLNGCCYGKVSHAWCSVTGADGQPRLPTQLLESASLFVLYLVLRRLQERRASAPAGWLSGVYLMSYAVIRMGIEFLRGDQVVVWAGLTLQQLLSIGVLFAGVTLVRPRQRNHGA